jgi:hypothetical protein
MNAVRLRRLGIALLFAIAWYMAMVAIDWVVGLQMANQTFDAWLFLLVKFLAFVIPSIAFAVVTVRQGLPFVSIAFVVLALLVGERLLLRQYEIFEWAGLTVLHLSVDVAGFLIGSVAGWVAVRTRTAIAR